MTVDRSYIAENDTQRERLRSLVRRGGRPDGQGAGGRARRPKRGGGQPGQPAARPASPGAPRRDRAGAPGLTLTTTPKAISTRRPKRARRYGDGFATQTAITTTSLEPTCGLKTPPRQPARPPAVSGPLSVTFIAPDRKST